MFEDFRITEESLVVMKTGFEYKNQLRERGEDEEPGGK